MPSIAKHSMNFRAPCFAEAVLSNTAFAAMPPVPGWLKKALSIVLNLPWYLIWTTTVRAIASLDSCFSPLMLGLPCWNATLTSSAT